MGGLLYQNLPARDSVSPARGNVGGSHRRGNRIVETAPPQSLPNCSARKRLVSPLKKKTECCQRLKTVAYDLSNRQHGHREDRARNTPLQNQKASEMMTRTGLSVNRLARSIGVTVSPSIK
jgi:hypothetical protein